MAVTTDELGTVMHCHRCGYTATTTTSQHVAHTPTRTVAAARREPQDWSERAESIWQRTQLLHGSLAETYLHHRCCMLPPPDGHLRYLPPAGGHQPSMVAMITDATTARPMSLHFTRLAGDGRGKAGTDRDKLLFAGHRKRGGVIRLWPDELVTYGLAIAEGIESALAAAHLQTPIWAAIDAGNLAAMPVLAGIDALTIYADHDDVGLTAARECRQRWRDAGREACVMRPRTPGHDMGDEVMAARRVAL